MGIERRSWPPVSSCPPSGEWYRQRHQPAGRDTVPAGLIPTVQGRRLAMRICGPVAPQDLQHLRSAAPSRLLPGCSVGSDLRRWGSWCPWQDSNLQPAVQEMSRSRRCAGARTSWSPATMRRELSAGVGGRPHSYDSGAPRSAGWSARMRRRRRNRSVWVTDEEADRSRPFHAD
jgi:hypothetical protein